MRVLVVAASTSGLWKPGAAVNGARTTARVEAIKHASDGVKLVMVPAGYWTAASRPSVAKLLSNVAATVAPALMTESEKTRWVTS